MVEFVPPPDPHRLLPPLLACLPTAFASHRPPPALLPLVSPILRQRLQLLTSTSAPSAQNWLRFLCWDEVKADRLKDLVENGTYEPHPSSGEIEVGDIAATKYRRWDQETLRAQIVLFEWDLTALYLWCGEDDGGGGWRLAELLPYGNDLEQGTTWSQSIAEANECSRARMVSEAIRDAEAAEQAAIIPEGDDDYWAQYDETPARSPARKRSPSPNGTAAARGVGHTEADYYAQYGEVQPAMETHDPSEESNQVGDWSLHGDVLTTIMRRQSSGVEDCEPTQRDSMVHSRRMEAHAAPVSHPEPSPLSSANPNAVPRLEERADQQSASEIGIRQHISTTMQSLYRLANRSGMEREEFNRIIEREMERIA